MTPAHDREMTYDDLDRLATASGVWGAGSYSYDALGNILTKNEGGETISISYDVNNLVDNVDIDPVVGSPYTWSYNHDEFGNVTWNGVRTLWYKLDGNMWASGGPWITYLYDGHNRRTNRYESIGQVTTRTVYGQNGRLMHKTVLGGNLTDYTYAGSMLVAKKEGTDVHFLHTDLLGSPIDGEVGTTSYTENYSPWGEKLDNPIQLADDVGYTGHQSDIETGLTYMQARYYDPVVGRFMAVDPVQFDGGNPGQFGRYTYANNNPAKYVDPDGQAAHVVAGAVAGGVFAGGLNAYNQYKENGDSFKNFDVSDFLTATGTGATAGGLIAVSGGGSLTAGGISGGANGVGSVVSDLLNGEEIDGGKAMLATGLGILGGSGGAKFGQWAGKITTSTSDDWAFEMGTAFAAEGAAAGFSVATDAAKNQVDAMSNSVQEGAGGRILAMLNRIVNPRANDPNYKE